MAVVKIDIAVGDVKFSGEGSEEWVAEQLKKVLATATELRKTAPMLRQAGASAGDGQVAEPRVFRDSLASFIKAQGAEANQLRRFLVTAEWLRRRGAEALTTTAVAKALKDNHQNRLTNPSDCLNKSVGQGLCEKTEDGFFITPQGLATFEPKA
jgi:hypothetical protein